MPSEILSGTGSGFTSLPFAAFGFEYAAYLMDINNSVFNAAAQFEIGRTLLGLLEWDLYRDKDKQVYASGINQIYTFLKGVPERAPVSDRDCVQFMPQIKYTYQRAIQLIKLTGGYGVTCIPAAIAAHPAWSTVSAEYVCTAKGKMALDSDPLYSQCVIQAVRDGEFDEENIFNQCFSTTRAPAGKSCLNQLFRINKAWHGQNAQDVCTVWGAYALDSYPAYDQCVLEIAREQNDGVRRTGSGIAITDGYIVDHCSSNNTRR